MFLRFRNSQSISRTRNKVKYFLSYRRFDYQGSSEALGSLEVIKKMIKIYIKVHFINKYFSLNGIKYYKSHKC